jgi:tRNA (cytidine/uridine-2'-O-)-methyltransferase
MFDVVLYQPEIPPNTGNVIRLCANTGCRLNLIRPLGFQMEDSQLKRAGLDYHEYAPVQVHATFQAFIATVSNARIFAFTTKASNRYDQAGFKEGDVLVFGPETRGLPQEVIATIEPHNRLRLPMVATSRSLNLSNAVAVVVYEALRQNEFRGLS